MKKVRTFFGLVVVIVMIMTSCKSTQEDNLGMNSDAKTLAARMVAGWNLGNTLEAHRDNPLESETSWRNPLTTKAMIDSVAAAGFNAVRIPVRWYPHFKQTSHIEIEEAWMNRVKEVVGYCLDNDMYVLLNTHHEHWLENAPFYKDSAEVCRKEKELWTQIALAFQEYDERVLFAGTNEVHVTNDWNAPTQENADVQNRFNQAFIDAVRATGGRNKYRTLIVQTYGTNSDYGPKFFKMPSDPTPNRLMVEIHYYDPGQYCATGETKHWGKPFFEKGIANQGQEDFLNDIFSRLKTQFTDNGYPMILGEYGSSRWGVDKADEESVNASRAYYYEQVVSVARKNGAVPFVWDNGYAAFGPDQFGLFDRWNSMKNIDTQTIKGILKGAQTSYPF